ncbi:MAG: methyl-accepting chemotaxis sensory transducer [Lachnospiraceae bacterium]|jgi:methyl-accepting chemotaxis protein|nr:methyl-accepting chemotaxis sensory transducer [Lachnospiraceae bacterium]
METNNSAKNNLKTTSIKTKSIKTKSIKTRLILNFIGLILLSSIALGVITRRVASNIITNEARKTITEMAFEAARLEEGRLETQKKTLELITVIDGMDGMDWKVQQPILKNMLEHTAFLEIGVMQMDGTVNYSAGTSLQLNEADPIRQALVAGNAAINFGISPSSGELVLVQAVPIKKDGQVVGAILGRRDGEVLSVMADDTGYGEEGFGYIIDGKGTIIGHKDREYVTSQSNIIEQAKSDNNMASTAAVLQEALNNKNGTGEYIYNGNQRFVGYSAINGTDWVFILVANRSEILAPIVTLQNYIILIVVLVLIVSIVITYFIGHSITKPVIDTVAYANKIAGLDLTENVKPKYLTMKDEIGDLAKALQSITNGVRNIIGEINNSAEQMAASSEELTATSQQTATASQEVAKTVEEIAQGASEQAKHTEIGSTKAFQLGATIEKVQGYIGNVNSSSVKATDVVSEGLKEIDALSKITEESTAAVEEIYQVIMKTNESSNKIGEASSVIESIAAQTNLLSLNAAIEAARAGDAGRGFAVVAEEIRKLAEQSSNSTKLINEIVSELQGNTSNAVQTMHRVTGISKEQSSSVNNSKNKYKLIAESMNESIAAVKQLITSGEEMDMMRLDILDVLESLSAIAEENAAAAEEASASTEEQTASVEEIAGASDSLSSLALNLHNLVAKFKL